MGTAHYSELKDHFDEQLKTDYMLLEFYYAPYCFRSGMISCRTNGGFRK